jgi:chromosome segregation ATPase
MTEEQMQDKIRELESKNLDLRNENADRRVKSKDLEIQVKELTNKLTTLEKEKGEIESKQGNEMELIKQRDSKIKELEKQLKDYEVVVNTFKEQEAKEIETIKSKIPENIRTDFENINDKLALQRIAELYSDRKPNSPLSESDSILSLAKNDPKAMTLEQKAEWYKIDPAGYNAFVLQSTKLNRVQQ